MKNSLNKRRELLNDYAPAFSKREHVQHVFFYTLLAIAFVAALLFAAHGDQVALREGWIH